MYKVEEFTTGNLYELEDFLNKREKDNYSVVQILQNRMKKYVTKEVSVDVPHYIIIFKHYENLG